MLYFIILSFVFYEVRCNNSKIHSRIHYKMTNQEVEALFGTDLESVPEYEMVAISHGVSKNNSVNQILHIKSLQLDIDLYLKPTEGYLASENMPIWEAQGDPNSPLGIKYTRKFDVKRRSKRFYQDPLHFAAFTCTRNAHGEMLFEGTIGDSLVIRPPPEELRKKFSRFKRSFPQSNRSDLEYTCLHFMYKKKETTIDGMRDKIGSYGHKGEKISKNRPRRSDGSNSFNLPKTIHPQILVILDYDMYMALKTVELIKQYVLTFWNAVDLRYRSLTNPEVRLNIAGIIYAKDPNGTPYIQNHRTRPRDGPILNVDQVLDNMAHYFFNETIDENLQRFVLEKDFDVAIAMTKLNLCNVEPSDNDFFCKTLGFAFHGGACTVNIESKLLESVAIVEDNSGYIGIVPAAHELAHLLGVPHDGDDEMENMKCSSYDGYIMTDMLTLNKNVFTWSSCSIEYFNEFFKSPAAECLFNEPKKSNPELRVLPGTTMSLDEQCDRIQGTFACNKDESACIALKCYESSMGGRCHPIAPAAEGSPCGDERYCINGKCLFINTTQIVLDYAPEPTEPPFVWDNRTIEIKRL